jgi:hypothetical protein
MVLVAAAAAGCILGLQPGSTSTKGSDTAAAPPGASAAENDKAGSVFERPLQKLIVEFKVHRFSAPAGTFSGEHAVWNVATGPLSDAAGALRLNDNGFRAAVGQESDRLPLLQCLDEIHGLRSVVDTATPDMNRAVILDLGSCGPRLTVFYYDRKGTLRGLDVAEARARFRLTFEMRSSNLREVWVEVTPELEEPPGPPKWVRTPEGAKQEPQERRQVFSDLAFSAQLQQGSFLLLGPAPGVQDHPLLARPFFVEQPVGAQDGSAEIRESIYVISPIVRTHVQEP